MAYESELALSLVPYTAGAQPKDRTFVKLNTNENPYPPSPRVAEAVQGQLDLLPRYPDMTASGLREAIAQVIGLDPAQVFCGNGSDEVLAFAFAAFFAGKRLVSADITYSFYDVPGELFGWLDSFDEPVEADAVLVQPGEGLWVSSPNTSFQLELPGVTL